MGAPDPTLSRTADLASTPTHFCACAEYDDDPGMVVCWRCEMPVVTWVNATPLDSTGMVDLLRLCVRYREALERLADPENPEVNPQAQRVAEAALNA
jgi:hypothetical protein